MKTNLQKPPKCAFRGSLGGLLHQRELLLIEIQHSREYARSLEQQLDLVNERISLGLAVAPLKDHHPEESLFALLRAAG